MEDKLKKKLKANGFERLIKPLEKVKPSACNQMAGGIQFVFENWDVAPNGGILTDIIDYLKNKASQECNKSLRSDYEIELFKKVKEVRNDAQKLINDWDRLKMLGYSSEHKTLFSSMERFNQNH